MTGLFLVSVYLLFFLLLVRQRLLMLLVVCFGFVFKKDHVPKVSTPFSERLGNGMFGIGAR